jgi:hypothetical protein
MRVVWRMTFVSCYTVLEEDVVCIRDECHDGNQTEHREFVLARPIDRLLRVIWAIEVDDVCILLFRAHRTILEVRCIVSIKACMGELSGWVYRRDRIGS